MWGFIGILVPKWSLREFIGIYSLKVLAEVIVRTICMTCQTNTAVTNQFCTTNIKEVSEEKPWAQSVVLLRRLSFLESMLKGMHLKARGEVLNHLLFDHSYINEILRVKLEICPSVLQQAKNPLTYLNLLLPLAKCMTWQYRQSDKNAVSSS